MQIINHRVNTISDLKKVPFSHGIELDVRYHEDDLILNHDPFGHHKSKPVLFEDFLLHWSHDGPMILNLKTEGIEDKCIRLMSRHKIKNWFFLDMSMPFCVKYSNLAYKENSQKFSPNNMCVRFSEREPIEYALSFKDKAVWVWVDCFTKLPIDRASYNILKEANFKLCIVSPELHKHSLNKIQEFKEVISEMDIDAVCTKRPDFWHD